MSLAIATASSSSSKGMIDSTGPKISSGATLHVVVHVGEDRRLDEEALLEPARRGRARRR